MIKRVVSGGLVALGLVLVAGCGGDAESVEVTVATVEPVRASVQVGERSAVTVGRVGPGEAVSTGPVGLARLRLDGGPWLLLGPSSRVVISGPSEVELATGRVFAEVEEGGDRFRVRTARGAIGTSDGSLSARVSDQGVAFYVVRGEVGFGGARAGIARAGEQVVLGDGPAQVTPATVWRDWTGGLARPGPVDVAGPAGVGSLEARLPDEQGTARRPLIVRRLDVRVEVQGDLAITEVDQVFWNPTDQTVEGLYRMRTPEGAVLQRFAIDRDGRLADAYVRERAQARASYDAQVYQGSTDDPALLEWDAPGSFQARIYPIGPRQERRIVVRYGEWLTRPAAGAVRLYRYPMASAGRPPHIEDFSLAVDIAEAGAGSIRAGLGATVEGRAVLLRRTDYRPRADFWLELADEEAGEGLRAYRAAHTAPRRAPDAPAPEGEADEADYFYIPLVLPLDAAGDAAPAGVDLVVVADVSAATDGSHLELGQSMVEALADHLGPDDRIAVVASDQSLRPVVEGEAAAALGPASPERVEALLTGLARVAAGGATDLGTAITAAGDLLDPSRRGAVIYVGDGAPTVGELGARELVERMARLPDGARLFAVAVGAEADLDLLATVTEGRGLAVRIEERRAAAETALRILSHLSRPMARQVTVHLGEGIESVYPTGPAEVVLGDVLTVVGRVRGHDLPERVRVTGSVEGRELDLELPLETTRVEDGGDLRSRWAGARLLTLLAEGVPRETVVDLGTRYGLITPYTSFYAPSARELMQMGQASLLVPLDPARRSEDPGLAATALAAVLTAPLSLMGCARGEPTLAEEQEAPAAAQPAASMPVAEGQLAEPTKSLERRSDSRYGVAAPEESQDMPVGTLSREAPPPPGALGGVMVPAATPPSPPAAAAPMAPTPSSAATELLAATLGDPAAGDDVGEIARARLGGGVAPARPPAEPASDSLLAGRVASSDEETIGMGGGSGYGRGAGGLRGRRAEVSGAARVTGGRMDRGEVRRVMESRMGAVNGCYERGLRRNPALAGRLIYEFQVGPSGRTTGARVRASTLGDSEVERCVGRVIAGARFPAPEGGTVTITYPFLFRPGENRGGDDAGARERAEREERERQEAEAARVAAEEEARRVAEAEAARAAAEEEAPSAHRARSCSPAASLPLGDRRGLWRERLAAEADPAGWVRVYRQAIRGCEAPSWRDRTALLDLVAARAGTVERLIQVHEALSAGGTGRYLMGAILRRVRTPADLVPIRRAFGGVEGLDWAAAEATLAAAGSAEGRVEVLRRLVSERPGNLELRLRLLAALEEAGHLPEAMRLVEELRRDDLADPEVRTALGEVTLRHGDETAARRLFAEMVEFAPYDPLARRRLGDLCRAHGWWDDAYRQYQTLAEIQPDDPSVHLLLAAAAAGAGRVDEALRLEGRVAESPEPGSSGGLARAAILLSSVRLAKLRAAARGRHDDDALRALFARMRRSAVLREAGDLRVSLVWSHPHAGLALWAAHPEAPLARPRDLWPDLGVEAFDVDDLEEGAYRIEVRRSAEDLLTPVEAELVVVWNEGGPEERIVIVPLRFDRDHGTYAWTLTGQELAEAPVGPALAAEVQ